MRLSTLVGAAGLTVGCVTPLLPWPAEYTTVVTCHWSLAADRSYGDAAHTAPCVAEPPARLDLVLAVDQDDDVEAYADTCDDFGGRFEVVTNDGFGHEVWVCRGVDY